VAIHPLSQTALAFFGYQARLVILSDEIIEIMIGFENDITATPAIPSAGTAFGPIFLTLKCDAAFAAMSRSRVNFYLVNKHNKKWNGERLEKWNDGTLEYCNNAELRTVLERSDLSFHHSSLPNKKARPPASPQ
jgi:hypothetical protein